MKALFKNISTMAFAGAALLLCGCSEWTEPQNLNFHPLTPEEKDPAAYAEYIGAVKAFKATEHNVMIVTMEGTSEYPSYRWQHPMDMPDSADFICIKDFMSLNKVIADELAQVRQVKGTSSLAYINYGKPEEVSAYLSEADRLGFDGLMIDISESSYAQDETFIAQIATWRTLNPDAPVILRGYAKQVGDTDFAVSCSYYVAVAGETTSSGQLILEVTRQIGTTLPSDRVLLEVSVPSSEEPEQKGPTPQQAAEWVLTQKTNRNFTPQGIVVANAHDDYHCGDMVFGNIRSAIKILNNVTEE